MMVIRDDQERAMTESFLRELQNDFGANRLGRRRNVVERNNQIILGRARRRDNRQELRGNSRSHSAKFRPRSPWEQVQSA